MFVVEDTPELSRAIEAILRRDGFDPNVVGTAARVSREQLSLAVWKQPFDPCTNVIDVHINKLCKKLRKLGLLG